MSQLDGNLFQVAIDVIEELCYEMGLHRAEALDEYAVFLVTHRGNVDLYLLTVTIKALDVMPSTVAKYAGLVSVV